jgi:hypothetical protein
MFFRGGTATPTEAQFAKVGRILTDWAILDNMVQAILSRLACSPDWPTGALTDHLQFEYRLRALQSLVEVHRHQFQYTEITERMCDDIDELRSHLSQLRGMRNRLAHWIVFRVTDDELAVSRLATRPASQNREHHVTYTLKNLDDHIQAVADLSERAVQIYELLPMRPSPFDKK